MGSGRAWPEAALEGQDDRGSPRQYAIRFGQAQARAPSSFVPFPSVVALMDQVASTIRGTVSKFPLDDYELRRLTGIKASLPSRVIVQLMEADVRALCTLVTAAAGEKEEKFIGCGVWKKMTEVFEKRGVGDFQAMAEVQTTGLLGEPGQAETSL